MQRIRVVIVHQEHSGIGGGFLVYDEVLVRLKHINHALGRFEGLLGFITTTTNLRSAIVDVGTGDTLVHAHEQCNHLARPILVCSLSAKHLALGGGDAPRVPWRGLASAYQLLVELAECLKVFLVKQTPRVLSSSNTGHQRDAVDVLLSASAGTHHQYQSEEPVGERTIHDGYVRTDGRRIQAS